MVYVRKLNLVLKTKTIAYKLENTDSNFRENSKTNNPIDTRNFQQIFILTYSRLGYN